MLLAVSRTGGGGAVGYSHVQATPADGYNIVWNSNSISTAHHKGNMPFGYEAFTPIARISTEVPAIAVRTGTGWTSLKEMAEAVKASDDRLKVGISGKGSFTHLTSAALFDALKKLTPANAQGEYYITDAVGIIRDEGQGTGAIPAVPPEDALGVNSRAELAEINRVMQSRI